MLVVHFTAKTLNHNPDLASDHSCRFFGSLSQLVTTTQSQYALLANISNQRQETLVCNVLYPHSLNKLVGIGWRRDVIELKIGTSLKKPKNL